MAAQGTLERRMMNFMVVAGLIILMTGCATQTEYGSAKINSSPEGAEVVNLKDSSNLGVTPVKVSFAGEAKTSEFVTIQLRKPGYVDRITTFWINRRHDSPEVADDNAIDIYTQFLD